MFLVVIGIYVSANGLRALSNGPSLWFKFTAVIVLYHLGKY